ncbi:MAG: MarR family winged helix-turn-helix transcriptional regulator [Pseudomonadota bacterium]|nr:MarR family winged helix-turn-helix transcriptional regulator [Pseudomonadota bacterium]
MIKKSISDNETLLLHEFLPYRLAVLAKAIGKSFSQTYDRKFGITNQQWRIIFALARKKNCSASFVVQHAALSKVQVSRGIAGLIEMKLVRRHSDTDDRRNSVLSLTKKGLKTYQQIVPEALKFEANLKSSLDNREIQALDRLLSKLMEKTDPKLYF